MTGSATVDGGDVQVSAGSSAGGGGGGARSGGGSAGSASTISCVYGGLPSVGGGGSSGSGTQILNGTPDMSVGSTVMRVCTDTTTGQLVSSTLITIAAGAPAPVVTGRDVAEIARARVVPPIPSPSSNPPNGQSVMNVPTWLWIASEGPVTATASAGGVSATVRATPGGTRWDMGDGGEVSCAGVGTPYDPSRDDAAQHTDCRYVYARTSGSFTVTVSQDWHLSFTATDGTTGDLGVVTRTSTLPVTVRELDTVVRRH